MQLIESTVYLNFDFKKLEYFFKLPKWFVEENRLYKDQVFYFSSELGKFFLGKNKDYIDVLRTKLNYNEKKNFYFFAIPAYDVAFLNYKVEQIFKMHLIDDDLIVFNPFNNENKLFGVLKKERNGKCHETLLRYEREDRKIRETNRYAILNHLARTQLETAIIKKESKSIR